MNQLAIKLEIQQANKGFALAFETDRSIFSGKL